jgi:methionyl-tRNA formyltransferase
MRIVFLGTPDFAAHSLAALIKANMNVVAVITAPDRKAGRGQKVQQSAVKKLAMEYDLPCLQPTNLKDPNFLEELKAYRADLQIVVAFRMLPELVWNMPAMGTMNLHASLLPAYRGAAPINWVIINGEEKSGVTTFLLKHEIDTGEILKQRELKLESRETAGSLHDKLMEIGAELLVESAKDLAKGEIKPTPQTEFIPEGKALADLPHAPKIFREDCKIEWTEKLKQVDQKIRGLSPYPTAWTSLVRKVDGKSFNLKIYDCQPTASKSTKAGQITSRDSQLFVSTADIDLEILELQMEGKKRMSARDFLNGVNLADYENILL